LVITECMQGSQSVAHQGSSIIRHSLPAARSALCLLSCRQAYPMSGLAPNAPAVSRVSCPPPTRDRQIQCRVDTRPSHSLLYQLKRGLFKQASAVCGLGLRRTIAFLACSNSLWSSASL
jgi:hypothetical protein